MVSDELRRAREENEKLRAKLRTTKAKLKRKKAEAKQLRRALAQEIDDKAARRRQELAVVAAATMQQPPRIMATPASMHASWSTSSSDASTVSPHSSHSSPSSASRSGSGSGSGSFVSSPLPVSSFSTPHAFPIAVMEHVHQCLPFLSAYLFSPRDFVVQDLRQPMLAFDMGNVMDPTIIYANPVLCQLLGFSPRPGYPLMKLWADSKNCEKQMPLLMETQPSMYISEFIFADPLLRCVNGFHVRASFLMQFFFDRRGRIKYGVACAESWRPDVPRDGESLREWHDDLHDDLLGALDHLVADDDPPFQGSGDDTPFQGSFPYAADHVNSNGGWQAQQDYDFGGIGGDHLPSTFMEEVTYAMRS
ncbi:uncharacterized protein ACA1_054880 [Acanthamoeba castellanii str. Neff]|uniref:PAS domain-containing protein n=1 Tax=Acanthamoeba castellanii (strain ATCC 30010 / Neff) TaxID=1257118 RepID=L8H684_ACACF|nr:uncharacterized protein ACA1_054880 [Acanthamoeba castellanii str. Neff]ELR20742.1 hypothetical protein ACA1_054880 [Acanthamoeba castellanii str. Neff]